MLPVGTFQPEVQGQIVASRPPFLGERGYAGCEISAGRGVSGRSLGVAPSLKVEFGNTLLLAPIGQHGKTTVELVDDIEDLVEDVLGVQSPDEQASDPKMEV